jgi:hypothetical protein
MDFISQGRKNMGARGKCPNFEKCMDKAMFVPPAKISRHALWLFLFVLLFLSLNWAGGEGAVPSKGEIISYFCKLASCVSHVYMYNFQSFF